MKMSLIASLAAAILLNACMPEEKTISVPEYLKNDSSRLKTLSWCKENIAERANMANCINADEAQYQIASGAYARSQHAVKGEK